jgi:hypothetical protein
VPSAAREAENHAGREEDAPDGRLEDDVYPKEFVYGRVLRSLVDILVVLVRKYGCAQQQAEEQRDPAAQGPGHGGRRQEVWRGGPWLSTTTSRALQLIVDLTTSLSLHDAWRRLQGWNAFTLLPIVAHPGFSCFGQVADASKKNWSRRMSASWTLLYLGLG